MREIKFRAWQDGQMLTQPLAGVYGAKRLFGLLYEDTELMQYTGLKDKKGKEIYEGDIVTLEEDDSKEYLNEPMYLNYGDVCSIQWSETNLAYYLMPLDESVEEQQMDYFGSWSGWNWIKVIGNIYENPELTDNPL